MCRELVLKSRKLMKNININNNPKRVFLIVLDACGVGAMEDSRLYKDPLKANTLFNVSKFCGNLRLPNLEKLGLANITDLINLQQQKEPLASFGKAKEFSLGKDTTTGHWEIAGTFLEKAFPVYPEGFPEEIIQKFISRTNCKNILGNIPASGTEIIKKLGKEHLETGFPIVYTSADSVFQVATHTDRLCLEQLYEYCQIAREILKQEHEVSRVIARPFAGKVDRFYRLSEKRKDYAIEPKEITLLDFLSQSKRVKNISIGKIKDIFSNRGLDLALKGKSNQDCLQEITEFIQKKDFQSEKSNLFVFANLVETDSHFGHRNDTLGFGKALEKIDQEITSWLENLGPEDLLILTADHGCDPTLLESTDHTREYVPVLAYSPSLKSRDLGVRKSFADVACTIADWFDLKQEWIKTKTSEYKLKKRKLNYQELVSSFF